MAASGENSMAIDTPGRTWVPDRILPARPGSAGEVFQLGAFASERAPPPSAKAPGPVPAIRVRSDASMIGREDELEWLGELWAQATASRRQIALLRGDRGLGKSRLAFEWARLRAADGRTLYGDAATTGPYEPFASALGPYINQLSIDAIRWVVGPDGGELSRLVGDLPRAVWSSSPASGEPAPGRHRLLEAVRAVLQRLCVACPTTLVIDNAHELDEDGLRLLQELLTLDDVPLLVLLLTRPYGGRPLETVIPGMRRDYVLHERALQRLREGEADRLFQALEGSASDREVRRTYGVPVDLENLALHRGSVVIDPEYAIVRDLEPGQRLLIDIAALAPDDIAGTTLAAAASMTSDEAAELLAHFERKGQLADTQLLGEHYWHFTHAVRRQAVLDLLEATRASELARRLADAMRDAGDSEPADIAALYQRCGADSEACSYFQQAGEAAERSAAYDSAARAFATALALAHDDPEIGADEAALANRIGACLWNAGKFREARIAYKEAAGIAECHGDRIQLALAAIGRAGRFGFEGPSGGAEVAGTCRTALDALGETSPELRARLLAALSHSAKFSEHQPAAQVAEYVKEAQDVARSLDDPELLVEVLCTTSWATWVPENLSTRTRLAAEAVELADLVAAERSQMEVLQLESRLFSMTCNLESGDLASARADCDMICRLANDERSPYYLALAAMGRAMLALLDGSERAEPLVFAALRIAQREHNPSLVRVFAAQVFYMRMLQGRLSQLRTASVSLAEYDTSIIAWRSGLALLFAETGEFAEAQAELEWAAHNDFERIPRDTFWLISMDNYARVAATLGDEAVCRSLVVHLTPHRDQFIVAAGAGAVHGPVALNLGVLHTILGDASEAAALLGRAKQLAAAAGCLPAATEALVEEAVLLTTSFGESDSVEELIARLTEATAAVEALPARKFALRLREALQLAFVHAAATDTPAAAGALDDLEARVLMCAEEQVARHGRGGIHKAVVSPTLRAITALTRGMSAEKVESLLAGHRAQRAVLALMQRFYQPQVAHPFTGTVVLNLKLPDPDAEPIVWSLVLGPDAVETSPTEPDNPDLLVRMPAGDFLGLLSGRVNGVQQWFDGHFDVQGDPILASRLVEIFGGPPPTSEHSEPLSA